MVQAKYLVTKERLFIGLLTGFGLTSIFYGTLVATLLLASILVLAHFAGRYGSYLLGGVMGDYLGATICITELLILTILLSVQTIMTDEYGTATRTKLEYYGSLCNGWYN